MTVLEIIDLHASIDGKPILKGVDLRVEQGRVHAIMGPNGSGKSTLANILMGHPKYQVTKGDIRLNGESVLEMKPDERAKRGLFLAFQYPMEIPGVNFSHFLMAAVRSKGVDEKFSIVDFRKKLDEKCQLLGLDKSFADRALNVGFSGGEKKRAEILQMAMLEPSIAVLDETDSGLDIDSLKIVAEAVNNMRKQTGALVITHYQRLLNYLEPDIVHVFIDGRIVMTGDGSLAHDLERRGYLGIMKDLGIEPGLTVIG